MKSSTLYAKKEIHADRPSERIPVVVEEVEVCPECSHPWNDSGPAHFTDCRYFSLDDDRDEDPLIHLGGCGYLSGEVA
jgi:hypothetical protein